MAQQLTEPDVAGVLFARNPATGADVRPIEAAWGLGEAVARQIVTPGASRGQAAGCGTP